MPRFFFDTYDGDRFVSDDVGLELDNVASAKAEAQRALPEMATDALPDDSHRTFVVNVRDETGKVVVRIALSLVIEEGTLDE
jgi:flagellar basal body-associated protein FliL